MRLLMATILVMLMAGCVTSEKIDMFKPGTEETRVCGPYTTSGNLPSAAMINSQKLRDCVMDYQRQGFERK